MSPFVAMLFPVGLFVIGLIGLIWAGAVQGRKAAANLQALAGQLGLEFIPKAGRLKPPARLRGSLRGRPAEVFTYNTGSGKSQQTWAAVTMRPAHDGGLTFTLGLRGFFTKIGEWFGRRGLDSGDPAFDAAWFARSNQPEFFTAALLPELRAKLMAVQAAGARGTFELKAGVIKYAELGTFSDAKRCARFPALADLAGDLADLAEVAGYPPASA